jgi:protein-disulfide isomerase
MTEKELQEKWSGDAWYIDDLKQKEVLHESGGLMLQLSNLAYNFGLVEPLKQQASIKIKNISNMPIQIKKAKSSCSCTVVRPSDDTILQPSQEMELNFAVLLKKGKNGFRYSIAIPFENLTDKTSQVLKVEVMGNCDEIETMQDKLSNIKHELQLLRSDIKKVFAELESVKTAQAKLQKKKKIDTKIYDVVVGSSPVLGPQTAPVTIVEFFDFQCPYCIREWPKIKQVLQDYPEKVRFVFKHFPLSFHKKAKLVHAAVEFARREGGDDVFWKIHDMIISNSKKLDVATLREYTESLGLNLTEFDALMANSVKIDELLQTDIAEARKCKVRSTPTVLINGLKLSDRSRNGYKTRIDQILAEVDKSK